jgi:hypothetical protein
MYYFEPLDTFVRVCRENLTEMGSFTLYARLIAQMQRKYCYNDGT